VNVANGTLGFAIGPMASTLIVGYDISAVPSLSKGWFIGQLDKFYDVQDGIAAPGCTSLDTAALTNRALGMRGGAPARVSALDVAALDKEGDAFYPPELPFVASNMWDKTFHSSIHRVDTPFWWEHHDAINLAAMVEPTTALKLTVTNDILTRVASENAALLTTAVTPQLLGVGLSWIQIRRLVAELGSAGESILFAWNQPDNKPLIERLDMIPTNSAIRFAADMVAPWTGTICGRSVRIVPLPANVASALRAGMNIDELGECDLNVAHGEPWKIILARLLDGYVREFLSQARSIVPVSIGDVKRLLSKMMYVGDATAILTKFPWSEYVGDQPIIGTTGFFCTRTLGPLDLWVARITDPFDATQHGEGVADVNFKNACLHFIPATSDYSTGPGGGVWVSDNSGGRTYFNVEAVRAMGQDGSSPEDILSLQAPSYMFVAADDRAFARATGVHKAVRDEFKDCTLFSANTETLAANIGRKIMPRPPRKDLDFLAFSEASPALNDPIEVLRRATNDGAKAPTKTDLAAYASAKVNVSARRGTCRLTTRWVVPRPTVVLPRVTTPHSLGSKV
jgi:hypothetical protein